MNEAVQNGTAGTTDTTDTVQKPDRTAESTQDESSGVTETGTDGTETAAADHVQASQQSEKQRSDFSGESETDESRSERQNGSDESSARIINAAEAQIRSDSYYVRETVISVRTVEVHTTRTTMVNDIASYLGRHMPPENGSLEIELNPVNLGRLMIRVAYDVEKTVVSIVASQMDTLRMLSQHAQQMGDILRRSTGEETTVLVPEVPQNDQADEMMNTEARSQNRREADENPNRSQNRRGRSDEFLNRMRLGMI